LEAKHKKIYSQLFWNFQARTLKGPQKAEHNKFAFSPFASFQALSFKAPTFVECKEIALNFQLSTLKVGG
jgi:hypothetical protein